MARCLLIAFNEHMGYVFIPGWLLGPDESIFAWRGKIGKRNRMTVPTPNVRAPQAGAARRRVKKYWLVRALGCQKGGRPSVCVGRSISGPTHSPKRNPRASTATAATPPHRDMRRATGTQLSISFEILERFLYQM